MKPRRTPLSGLTERQREIELGNAHALMVESGIATPTFNQDCSACSWPPEVYARIAGRAVTSPAANEQTDAAPKRDLRPQPTDP